MVTNITPKFKKGQYAGTSADQKPMDVQNGSVYFEVDTGKYYMFDEENRQWYEQKENSGSEGTLDHTKLTNRDKPDQHPIGAVTGLQEALNSKASTGDIPTKLPSPNALTFTGAVSATYDGSTPVTVDIPQGGSGGYPQDNPAMTHNLPRGKFLGNSVTEKQYVDIANGSFKDMYVGDYWTIGGKDYVIAGVNYYKNCGDTSTAQNHLVMVPRRNLYSAQMHNTESGGYEPGEANTTVGGYVNSDMRTTNLEKAKTMINEAFPGHVLTKRLFLVNAVSNGQASAGAWVNSTVDLMNEQMVYGCPVLQNMRLNGSGAYIYRVEKSQLPIFAYAPEMMNTHEYYWLQDVVSASLFAGVSRGGLANDGGASDTHGVRPAFVIG